MKKVSRVVLGGTLVALGCGCFLYPNFREWNTQREVESVIDKFDETYKEGLDTITSEPTSAITKSNSDSTVSNQTQSQASTAGSTDNKSSDESKDNNTTSSNNSKNSNNTVNTVTETPVTSTGDDNNTDNSTGNADTVSSESNLSDDTDSDSESATRPYQNLYDEMVKYNKDLAENGQDIVDAWSYEQQPLDLSSLDIDEDNPVIGYIEIPDMKIRLPLMLGASTKNLEKGAAVLSETSMPIGGENTNCVIAGHRGWEGSAYFQFIENMKKGSKVYITNPWETLVYECTSTQVIYPDDVGSILIQPGKDMVTLFSCHPYVLGGGPYRYLVFCERVATQKRQEADGVINPDATTPAPAEEADNVVVTEIDENTSSQDTDSQNTDKDLNVDNSAQTPDNNDGSSDDLSISDSDTTQSTQQSNISESADSSVDNTTDEIKSRLEDDPDVIAAEEKGTKLLALEQTLRYMLPIIVIALSAIVILFRNHGNKTSKRKKKKSKKTAKRKNKTKKRGR